MSNNNQVETFTKAMLDEYKVLSVHLMELYEKDPELIVAKLEARMVIWKLDMNKSGGKWFTDKLYTIDGCIIPFIKEQEYAEIGFDPYDKFELKYDDLNVKEGTEDPWLWTMSEIEINGKWCRLLLHQFAEPVQFTSNHEIVIDKLGAENFHGTEMSLFNKGQLV